MFHSDSAGALHWFSRAAVVLTAAALGAGCGGSSGREPPKPIAIGAVLSLTGAGSVYGPQQRDAVRMGVDEVNAKGGIAGRQLALTVLDDGSDKQQSARYTQRLIRQDKVVGLIGPTLSNSAVAAHPIADALRTPMLAVSTTGLHIVGDCPYPCTYIFRDSLGEAAAIPTNIRTYAAAAHPKTAVLLYPNDDKFSVDGATAVWQSVAAARIRLLGVIEFTKAESDLSPYVAQTVQMHPDVIFITSLGAIPSKLMIEARRQGFKGKFLGGNGFNTAAVSVAAGAAGAGAQSASGYSLGNRFATNAQFVAAYRRRYAAVPDQFAAQAYTGVLILADALRRSRLSGSLAAQRDSVRSALAATSIDTPLGPFRFTPTHDVRQTIWINAMDGHGGFRLVTAVKP